MFVPALRILAAFLATFGASAPPPPGGSELTTSPFCFCTQVSPCGNTGAPGHGCANGRFPDGALLDFVGSASAEHDDLILVGTNLPPSLPGLYFQGDQTVNGNQGVVFGDGLRCVGTNTIRLQVVQADAFGRSQTSVSIATSGGVSPGDVKHYQLWYRDGSLSPCGAGFNLTNALTLEWS